VSLPALYSSLISNYISSAFPLPFQKEMLLHSRESLCLKVFHTFKTLSLFWFDFALPQGVSHATPYTVTKASSPGLFSIATSDGTPVRPPASNLCFTACAAGGARKCSGYWCPLLSFNRPLGKPTSKSFCLYFEGRLYDDNRDRSRSECYRSIV
jgi:hypothetical protein